MKLGDGKSVMAYLIHVVHWEVIFPFLIAGIFSSLITL